MDDEARATKPRRDRGDGAVYRAADGRWRGAVELPPSPDGRRRRRYINAATEIEAKRKIKKLRSDVAEGRIATDPGVTVAGWLRYWLTEIAGQECRQTTIAGYSTIVEYWAIPFWGQRLTLEKLTVEKVESLYRHMREQGKSPTTIRLAHRVLARAMKLAHIRGKIAKNVVLLATVPAAKEVDIAPLSVDTIRKVLAEAEAGRNAPRWSVAFALGLRQGEALGLLWDDVDLEVGTITVRCQLQRIAGAGLQLVPVKSSAGRRVIHVPPTLLKQLRAHRRTQDAERVQEGPRWTGWETQRPWPAGPRQRIDLVFSTRLGRPISREDDWAQWKVLLLQAGVAPIGGPKGKPGADDEASYAYLPRVHDARHAAATLMLVQGVDPRVVMQTLGWSKLSMVTIYQHVVPELKDRVSAAMESAIWGPDTQSKGRKKQGGSQSGSLKTSSGGRRRPKSAVRQGS